MVAAGIEMMERRMTSQSRTKSNPARKTPARKAPSRQAAIAAFVDGLDPNDTAHNRVYLALKNELLSGRFRPGEVVTLRKLSELLGTSEMPVREAVKRLTTERAFEVLPNRTTRIPLLTRPQVLEILEIRKLLEGRAVEEAIEHISNRQLERLAEMQAEMEKLTAAGEADAFTALNKQFHFEIYALSGNRTLLDMIEALWMRMAPLIALGVQVAMASPGALMRLGKDQHTPLLDAFRTRDGVTASRALQADLQMGTEIDGYWEAIERATQGARSDGDVKPGGRRR
jgi:DNA-binding GntR family transcriptional regulator